MIARDGMEMNGVHVLQLIDGLNMGGAEALLRDLAVGLQQRGFRVSIGYSTPGPLVERFQADGLKLARLPRLARVDPTLLIGMIRLMRDDPPDIVHTHLFKSDFHGRVAARMAGAPVVVSTLHNSDRWAQQPLFGALYGATARYADRLIAVSEEVRQYHLEHTHIPAQKVITIENGVALERFAGQEAAGKALRSKLHIDAAAPLFGIIGRLKPQKDHATFLQVAANVLQRMPAARFLIVGDGPLRPALEAQAQDLGLQDAVIFTGLRDDIPAVLAAIDVLVFSSLWEGLPVTLLEGMAAACPVVATAVDGVRGAAIPGKTALLAPSGDVQGLADACLRLVDDPALARQLGEAARQRVRAHYSIDSMIDRTVDLYMELLQARGFARTSAARGARQGEGL